MSELLALKEATETRHVAKIKRMQDAILKVGTL